MNGRIFHEPTPAKRAAALAFSVFLAKWKEFRRKHEVQGARVDAADRYVEEFLDYADLNRYLDILMRLELAQAALDEHATMETVLDPTYRERNRERKDELRLTIARARLELEDLKL